MKQWKPPAENIPNIVDRITEGAFMPQFFQLINMTEYGEALKEMAVTVFVPVENVIDFVSESEISKINQALKDTSLAKEIVENHIVEEPLTLKEMINLKEIKTVSGKVYPVNVTCNISEDYDISVRDACFVEAKISKVKIDTANILCYNGFIHTIEGILV